MTAMMSGGFAKIAAVVVIATLVSAAAFVASDGGPAPAHAGTRSALATSTLASSERSFTDSTTALGANVTTTTFIGNVATYTNVTMAFNQTTTQSEEGCPVTADNSPDDVPNAPSGQVTAIFGSTASSPANTTTIPANTLVWDTWTLSEQVLICGAMTQFLPGNLTASPIFAFYVDGRLVTQASTPLPAGPPVNGTNWNVFMSTPLYINQTVAANSTVTLALLSSTPVTVFTATDGQTYSSNCTSLPVELPATANSSADYAIGMFGFTDP